MKQSSTHAYCIWPPAIILRIVLSAVLLLTFLAGAANSDSSRATRDNLLRVGVRGDCNPFEFADANLQPLGFTPALLNEIVRQAGRKLDYQLLTSQQIREALLNGQIDLAAMALTPEVSSLFATSGPLAQVELSLYTTRQQADRIDPDHLAGNTIAMEPGGFAAVVLAGDTSFQRKWVKNIDEGFALLTNRQVDGVFAVTQTAGPHLESHHLHQVKKIARRFKAPYVLVSRSANQGLIDELNTAIKSLEQSGKLEILQQRWLEEPITSATWWQRSLPLVTVVFGILLVSTLLLMAWSFALYRKFRHKSCQLEQSLDITNELISDLDEQRRQADRFLEISKAMIVGLDRNGIITLANLATCDLLGFSQDELVGRNWFDTCIPEDIREELRRVHLENLDTQGEDPKFTYYDNQVFNSQGERLTIHWHNTVVKDEKGLTVETLSSGIDITQRVKSIRELSESREQFKTLYNQFESLLHGISEPLLIIGQDLDLLWANRAARDNWFLSKAVKKGEICHCFEICQHLCDEECVIKSCFRENQELVYNHYHSSGRSMKIRVFPASIDAGQPQSVILMAQDVTDVLKHRTEMARASQLANVGELAANVAHEINNPLHGIINYADILKNRSDDPNFTREIVTRISNEGERISLIVKNLLDYTRNKDDKPGPTELPLVIQSADMLLGHKLKMKNIVVELDIPAELPLIKGRSHQLQQVFVNLFGNAHDALLEKDSAETEQRRILIRARQVEEMIEVCCEDNGIGIPEAVLNRTLESFFTTKPVGKGTGLGLSISKSIIEEHGGKLWVESVAGEWTRVYFTLPRFLPQDIGAPEA